jgi:soluble lytic murein transglycosylase-like protein
MAGNMPGGSPAYRIRNDAALRRADAQIPELNVRARPRADLMTAPLVEKEADRRVAILRNDPATFYVAENPEAKPDVWRGWPGLGSHVVQKYDGTIEDSAKKANIDPNLLRSVIWQENAKGIYDLPAEALEALGGPGLHKTLRPGNINPELWSGLGIDREGAKDPVKNIEASARLLAGIQQRVFSPTPAKIAELYNGLGRDIVSQYGATVENNMKVKPWVPTPPRNLGR